MARFRKVDPRTWGDKKFRELSHAPSDVPDAQRVWFYLLTGPETTSLPGVICIGEAALAEAVGMTTKAFRESFQEIWRKDMAKADWGSRFVWVPNSCKYNKPQSPNVVRSWRDHWDNAPECDLKGVAFLALESFCKGLGEGYLKAFREACGKVCPNQEQEQEQEQETTTPAAPPPVVPPAKPKKQKSKAPDQPLALLQHYHDSYLAKYGVSPVVAWKGAARSTAKTLLAGRTLPEALAIVDGYLADNSDDLVDKHHPLGWLPSRANAYLDGKAQERKPAKQKSVGPIFALRNGQQVKL